MTEDDSRDRARADGLTHAVAAITASLVIKGVVDASDIMQALDVCKNELRQMQEPTLQSDQVHYLRDELRRCLPVPRMRFDD